SRAARSCCAAKPALALPSARTLPPTVAADGPGIIVSRDPPRAVAADNVEPAVDVLFIEFAPQFEPCRRHVATDQTVAEAAQLGQFLAHCGDLALQRCERFPNLAAFAPPLVRDDCPYSVDEGICGRLLLVVGRRAVNHQGARWCDIFVLPVEELLRCRFSHGCVRAAALLGLPFALGPKIAVVLGDDLVD